METNDANPTEPARKRSFNVRRGRVCVVVVPPSAEPQTVVIDPHQVDGQMHVVIPPAATIGHQSAEESA